MTRILLDTHYLLWALGPVSRLPGEVRRTIEASEVHVSAASIWEIGIKAAVGKLAASSRDVLTSLERSGFLLLPVTGEHAVEVSNLPFHHKDPFDRMLIAQARLEGLRLLTKDDKLRAYGDVVWLAT